MACDCFQQLTRENVLFVQQTQAKPPLGSGYGPDGVTLPRSQTIKNHLAAINVLKVILGVTFLQLDIESME